MPKIKLTYFNIEGAAEPVRLALAVAGQDYEDERINFPDWKDLKPKTPYGQLPLMVVDDGPTKTQSGAMLRWVGSACSKTLYPADKIYEIEEALGVLDDMRKAWEPCVYMSMAPTKYGRAEDFASTDEGKALIQSMRTTWIQNELPIYLGRIEGLLEKAGGDKWLVAGCNDPTIADCMAVSQLRAYTKGHMDHVDKTCLESHPKVVAYVKRFCDLPQIKGRYSDGIGSSAY